MQEQITTWTLAAASLLAVAMLLLAIYTWPRGERRRCPGDRRWRGLWNPHRWIRRSDCWQDLNGVRCSSDGEVRCPECGRSNSIRRLLRDGRRFRLGLVGLVLGVIAVGSHLGVGIHSGRPLRTMPTTALVLLSNTTIGEHRTVVRKEIERRVDDGSVAGFDARRLADVLVRDLRADARKWNANTAFDHLQTMWPDSQAALEHELVAGDRQSRKIAAQILRQNNAPPSHSLLITCVDDLADDWDVGARSLLPRNNRKAASYLIDHYRHASDLVRAALDADDPQQRWLAMIICGFARDSTVIDRVVPILAAELRDGPGNARAAAVTLFRFGPPVIEALRPYADDDDRQCRETVRSIIERLEHPDRTWDQLRNRMPRISWTTHDPLSLGFWEATE
ncbi:MAG: hypothetical protein GY895_12320 [Phycisphaera sp.]|nr:hypothetical protein [Phycisphaera sp.]